MFSGINIQQYNSSYIDPREIITTSNKTTGNCCVAQCEVMQYTTQ